MIWKCLVFNIFAFFYQLGIYWFHLWHVFLFQQISNFVIGLYFLSVVNKFGISSVYLGFAGVCALAVLYIAGNVVETKGRSLEEIELALNPTTWFVQYPKVCSNNLWSRLMFISWAFHYFLVKTERQLVQVTCTYTYVAWNM